LALRDKIKLILEVRDTPHRLSIAFAAGVFIGMSPLFGIHTLLGLLVASVFRLNKLTTIVGVYITNPWTIIPIYTFSTWVGAKCLGVNKILPDVDWRNMTFSLLLKDFGYLLMPFLLGTIIMGVLSAVIAYIILYHLVKKRNV
jgi:uncharacterized protein (DUF2062 family)